MKNRSLWLGVLIFFSTPVCLLASAKWTVMVYMAGDNNLFPYALQDINEMKLVGSNNNLSIVVQLDGYGSEEKTERLLIQKDQAVNVDNSLAGKKLDSGNPQTLIDFCTWATDKYPADHYMLVLWNHGSGILDPLQGRSWKASDFFIENNLTGKLEIDRSLSFIQWIAQRGVCFSDTNNSYINDQGLSRALYSITKHLGKKIDIIAFDACMMAMAEVINTTRFYADYLIGSEEVEPGDGWHYSEALLPLTQGTMNPSEFAIHAVEAYRSIYTGHVSDFTQSAIDLNKSYSVLNTIDRLSQLLLKGLAVQIDRSLELAILASRDGKHCLNFAEPAYIDLLNFYRNLMLLMPFVKLEVGNQLLIDQISKTLESGIKSINQIVIASAAGTNLTRSGGISIYFPTKSVDQSYEKTSFARENSWIKLLHYFS